MSKTVLITGSNSGIGKLAAETFAQKGWTVIATMRSPEKAGSLQSYSNVHIYPLDVSSSASITANKAKVLNDFKQVDVIVNNAGFGCYGAFEAATEEQIDRQLAVNVKGVMMMCKIWLAHFREKKGGMFINVSSVAGLASYPLASLYISSKWAVEGFTEALFYELKPLNIQVKLVEPGGFKSNFQTTSITWTNDPNISGYDERTQKVRKARDERQDQLPDPIVVAQLIHQVSEDSSDRLRYLIGDDAAKMMAIRREEGAQKYIEQTYQKFIS